MPSEQRQAWASPSPKLSPLRSSPLSKDVLLPPRLLATAYDSKWRLKVAVPKECYPLKDPVLFRTTSDRRRPNTSPCGAGLNMSRSLSELSRPHTVSLESLPAGLEGSLSRSASMSQVGSRHASKAPVKRGSLEVPGSRHGSKFIAGSRHGSKAFPGSRHGSKASQLSGSPKRGGSKLEPMYEDIDRPSSAGSGRSQQKEDKDAILKAALEDDLNREEKTLAEHALEAGTPLDIAKQALDMFMQFCSFKRIKQDAILYGQPFDFRRDLGTLNTRAFGKACLRIADVKDFDQLPEGFLEEAMVSADKNASNDIDFFEFLYFYYKFSFSEEVMISPEERQMRSAAREHKIPYNLMSKYKYVFDQTDTDKSGLICHNEFAVLVSRLMKAPKGELLPEHRTHELFIEALRKGPSHTHLDFITFAGWYKQFFGTDDEIDTGESPFEAYYQNIRRVAVSPHAAAWA